MTDFREIDSFFNGQKPIAKALVPQVSRRAKVLRFLKLAMPSAAAVLVAGVLLLPTLKDNKLVADFDVTLPKKGELEKLHIEQTKFSVTDKNNKVSTFTADQIDETEAGSKVMKIINPKGQLQISTNDDDIVHINSDIGYYNQQANIVQGRQNVKAVTSDETVILTESADYDFKKSFGFGKDDVYAYGDWGKLWAEGFEYHQDKNLMILNGKSKIQSENRVLEATKQIRYYRAENRIEADGNVRMQEKDDILYADKAVAYLTDDKKADIKEVQASGNVRIETPRATATGDRGVYKAKTKEAELIGSPNKKVYAYGNWGKLWAEKMTYKQAEDLLILAGKPKVVSENRTLEADKQIRYYQTAGRIEAENNVCLKEDDNTLYADRAIAYLTDDDNASIREAEVFDHVKILTPKGAAQGDRGIYRPTDDEVELIGNVVLEQNENMVFGSKAVTNLKTSVSRVLSDESGQSRVSGVIRGKTVKSNKN